MPISHSSSRRMRKRVPVPVSQGTSSQNTQSWGNTTKLVVALALLAAFAWLFIRFQNIVGPLLLSFVLAYLLYPAARWLSKWSRMSWRWSVSIVFVLFVIVILGLFTLGGLAVIEQAQSLIRFLDRAIKDLPNVLDNISSQPIVIGPFSFQPDFSDLNVLGQDLLSIVQPLLGRAGSLVGSVASGAANFFALFFFTMLVAYFILAEGGAGSGQLIKINIPGFSEDYKKFGIHLGRIWNAFLRGQLTIILITVIVYTILLGSLGLRFFIGLALLAGLARFIPYVGPAVAWTTYGLVAFFQGSTAFGLTPIWYVVLVVGVAWFTDIIMDNFVSIRLMGDALQIHPAAVMVSALVGANLFGIVGVVLAAPVVATMKLAGSYIIHRMMDLDPWESISSARAQPSRVRFKSLLTILTRTWKRTQKGFLKTIIRFRQKLKGDRNANPNRT